MIETAQAAVQTMENRLALSLGPGNTMVSVLGSPWLLEAPETGRLTDIFIDVCQDRCRRAETPICRHGANTDGSHGTREPREVPPIEFGLIRGEGVGVFDVLNCPSITLGVLEFEPLQIGHLPLLRERHGEHETASKTEAWVEDQERA